MTYESIGKLKKYMQKKIDAIVTGEKVTFNINAHQLLDEINEMERKAKDWDEILAIHNMDEKYEDTIGDYEQYIDKLVKKHLEDE